ncbi:MAG: formylglycine-generating enzyme family protein [Anaerolineaceae bacterium]
MNISQRTIWILVGAITGVAALVFIVLMVINKTRQSTLPPPTPTISVELAMAEIQMKMTAESLAVLVAAATQTALAPTATQIPTPTPEPAVGTVQVSPIDGMEMVYIPMGSFWMGAQDTDTLAQFQEKPLHEVMVSGFWMDRELITNGMYMRCVESGRCTAPVGHDDINTNYGKGEYLNYPTVYISWDQADVYCHAVGRRLPTEAEWEKAARGTDGRIYPWGDNPPDGELANFNDAFSGVQAIGRYLKGASPYGVLDMAGNAREWVHDWFSETYYGESAAIAVPVDPTGPEEGSEKVLRGGSFTDAEIYLRTTSRLKHVPYSPGDNRGFRCAFSDVSPY